MEKQRIETGAIVEVTKNTCNHNYTIGRTYEAIKNNHSEYYSLKDLETGAIGNQIILSDMKRTNISKEYIQKTIESLKKSKKETDAKINNLENKILWMEETGNEFFVENEFKAYQTLKLIDNNELSLVEKSKLIAQLIG